jgi:hypothetical protein
MNFRTRYGDRRRRRRSCGDLREHRRAAGSGFVRWRHRFGRREPATDYTRARWIQSTPRQVRHTGRRRRARGAQSQRQWLTTSLRTSSQCGSWLPAAGAQAACPRSFAAKAAIKKPSIMAYRRMGRARAVRAGSGANTGSFAGACERRFAHLSLHPRRVISGVS